MLRPRVIPCLLVQNKGLVKTVKFSRPKYVGDPINAVKIFNEKQADELILLDIAATVSEQSPDFKMIERIANESQMPLCYGGGVRTVADVKTIISLGVEKVALSSAILKNLKLLTEISEEVGCQSVVAVLDVKRRLLSGKYEIWSHNGRINTGKCPIEFSKDLQTSGVGEIVLNSIDNDGVMKGYDLTLVKKVKENITVPMTILGGAGSLNDIGALIKQFNVIGAAAGSLFIFKGIYNAVLINYPSSFEKDNLFSYSSSCY